MMKQLEVRRFDFADKPEPLQTAMSRLVQEIIRDDFMRIGVPEAEAVSVADPDNAEKVEQQRRKILSPSIPGTEYRWFGEEDDIEMRGIVKVGPIFPAEVKQYGFSEVARLQWQNAKNILPGDRAPRGLHAFSVEQGLTKAALTLVRAQLVPPRAVLKAEIHERDEELMTAFTELGAPASRKRGVVKLGNHAAQCTLRTLPAVRAW